MLFSVWNNQILLISRTVVKRHQKQQKHCFLSVYFELITKQKFFYSDSNILFLKQKWIQSCGKPFNFCHGKKNFLFGACVIHLDALRCKAFPCFNLLEQNHSYNMFSASVLICEEAPQLGASWVVCYQNKCFNFDFKKKFFFPVKGGKGDLDMCL